MDIETKALIKTMRDKTSDDIKFRLILIKLGFYEITVKEAIDEINKLDSDE